MGKLDDLNPRQRKFVVEYVLSGNATQAAIAAGYSAKTAEVQGYALIRNPKVSVAIAESRQKLEIRTEITQDRVLAELALLAFSDITHYAVDDKGNVKLSDTAPKHAMRAVSSIKLKITTRDGEVTRDVEVKLWDKPGPLKLAGRHVGLFPDKIELTTKEDKPLAIIISGAMPVPPELAGEVGVVVGPNTTSTADAPKETT